MISEESESGWFSRLSQYHRIVLLTEGQSSPRYAKTAMSLLRYRQDDIVAILDSNYVNETADELFGVGEKIPVVSSCKGIDADSLFLGTSSPGGRIPPQWRPIILDALDSGIDVVSGNHELLVDDDEYRQRANLNGCRLVDIRCYEGQSISNGEPLNENCLRVLTVGQDCSVGKMVTSLEVCRVLQQAEIAAQFVATGQTGIMISGDGIPADSLVADFLNGTIESHLRQLQNHEVLMIEGQGSLSHPSFSAVTAGLLHGCVPQCLIYCYELGRTHVKGLDQVPLQPHRRMIEAYLSHASLRADARLIAIAVNGRNVSAQDTQLECSRIEAEFGVPTCDVYRDGAERLADAVIKQAKRIR